MINERALPEGVRPLFARLCGVIGSYGSMLIAYSGGVDSGLLAFVARHVLGDGALPVLGVSPSLGLREKREAAGFLRRHRIPYELIDTEEMLDERYRNNDADRCYYCKSELFSRLADLARARGFQFVAYGANLDDAADYRPGARAATERNVVAPLAEAGLTKQSVRDLALALDLELWSKPASPCLASRIPYYQEVTPEKLAQVERAEGVLKALGFKVCRVRHHGETARIELPLDDHARVLREEVWDAVVDRIRRAGFREVALERDGFRSGRLNEDLGRP